MDESIKFFKGDFDHPSPLDAAIGDNATFIGQMDREAIFTLSKLSADVEGFTLKELKQMHRRSRVAIEAEMTNNRHVHMRIMNLLEKHLVIDTEEQILRARKEVMACYKAALERCSRCHEGLREAERLKLKAEEEYIEAVMELNKVEQEKNKVISATETRNVCGIRRKRTTSM